MMADVSNGDSGIRGLSHADERTVVDSKSRLMVANRYNHQDGVYKKTSRLGMQQETLSIPDRILVQIRAVEMIVYRTLVDGDYHQLVEGMASPNSDERASNETNVQRTSTHSSGYLSYWSSQTERYGDLLQAAKIGYSNPELYSPLVDKTLPQTQEEVEEKIAELKNELEQNEDELTFVMIQAKINQRFVVQEARKVVQRKIVEICAAAEKGQKKLMAKKSALNQKLQECIELKSHLNEVNERPRKLSLDVDPKTPEPSSCPNISTLTPPAFAGPRSLVLCDIISPVCQLYDGNQLPTSDTPIVPNPRENSPGVIGDRRRTRTSPEPEVPFGPLGQYQRSSVVRYPGVPHAVKIVDGNKGQGEDKLCRPWGIACYPGDGRIFVVDRSHHRIMVYDSNLKLMQRFGTRGPNPGQFNTPTGIAVDAVSRVVVADKGNHRIQIFTPEGLLVLVFGKFGKKPGYFDYPWDVATNSKCEIVVSDSRNGRIQLFDFNGKLLRLFSFNGFPHAKPWDLPRSVAFTPEDDVVLTNFDIHTVMKVSKDFSTVRILTPLGASSAKNGLYRPQGIVVDGVGNIIVADSRNNRVQVFDRYGTHLWSFGENGKADYQMNQPAGITLLPNGNVALVDFGNNRVMVF